jgi:hypothetical protein
MRIHFPQTLIPLDVQPLEGLPADKIGNLGERIKLMLIVFIGNQKHRLQPIGFFIQFALRIFRSNVRFKIFVQRQPHFFEALLKRRLAGPNNDRKNIT